MTVRNLPSTEDKDVTKIAMAVRQIAHGRSNATGTVTLTASATSTVVSFDNCSSESQILLFPKTANAAGALATTYVSSVGNKTFTISHASAASTDRTFGFLAIG